MGKRVRFEILNEACKEIAEFEAPEESVSWQEVQVGEETWPVIYGEAEEGSVALYVNPEKVAAILRYEGEANERSDS